MTRSSAGFFKLFFSAPFLFLLAAMIITALAGIKAPIETEIDIEDLISEGILVIIAFAGIIIVNSLSENKRIYHPIAVGNFIIFIGFYADLLDEIFSYVPSFFGYELENFVWVGMVLAIIGLHRLSHAHIQTKKELEKNISELKTWEKNTVGRELVMVQLKNEIKNLKEQLKK